MKELKGTMVVMVTPFAEDGQIDEQGFRKNIDWYIEEGVHGLICNGSTGEFANMNREELGRTLNITVDQAKGRVPVMAGTAANTTKETIELTQNAEKAGADAAMIRIASPSLAARSTSCDTVCSDDKANDSTCGIPLGKVISCKCHCWGMAAVTRSKPRPVQPALVVSTSS